MNDVNDSEEKYIILENISSEDKKCEFEVTFPNTIYLDKPYECALLQVTLPNKLYVNRLPFTGPIYIYTDIVKETHCGNVKANILRVLLTKLLTGEELVDYSFDNLMFIPLLIQEIHSIKISCADSTGITPTYEQGYISLSLLLRPSYENGRI